MITLRTKSSLDRVDTDRLPLLGDFVALMTTAVVQCCKKITNSLSFSLLHLSSFHLSQIYSFSPLTHLNIPTSRDFHIAVGRSYYVRMDQRKQGRIWVQSQTGEVLRSSQGETMKEEGSSSRAGCMAQYGSLGQSSKVKITALALSPLLLPLFPLLLLQLRWHLLLCNFPYRLSANSQILLCAISCRDGKIKHLTGKSELFTARISTSAFQRDSMYIDIFNVKRKGFAF